MPDYTFDVKLFASITVSAANEAEAEKRVIGAVFDSETVRSSDGIEFEVSMDGDADLVSIDGEDV